MSSNLGVAIRRSMAAGIPPLPREAILVRERAAAVRQRRRRNALAALVLVLSFAGLAALGDERLSGTPGRVPAPIASLHPLPTIT
jgi:hypothetical protein